MKDKAVDAGLVVRTSENYTPDGGGWARTVEYKDALGNSLERTQAGPERGRSPDFDQLTTTCANGRVIPRNVAERVNAELLEGHRGYFWTSREHDFGHSNPLNDACAVAPRPRAR